jgi:diguanylate cyclase (GGDEF)-like protein/putative nucleotidyltransferase with HDIG domain
VTDPVRLDHLRGLVAVSAAMRAGGDARAVLEVVARTISEALGFGTVAVNLHRPADDDFEAVVVHGAPEARAFLLGRTSRLPEWSAALDPRFELHDTFLIPRGAVDWSEQDELALWWVPEDGQARRQDPEAWHPDDALLVPLRASTGALLGIVSVDEPADGRRPTDAEREVLAALVAHAAIVVEHAQGVEQAARHRAQVEHLLRVSAQITGHGSVRDVLDAVCTAARDALGFGRVLVLLSDGGPGVRPGAAVGWDPADGARFPQVNLATLAPLLEPGFEREGCVLLPPAEARARAGGSGLVDAVRGVRRAGLGRGPHGWGGHVLLVPLRDRDGALCGVLWADEPADRLVPTTECLQALRALANQAMAAVESARQLHRTGYLAEHDPLTGLRNRRTFELGLDRACVDGPLALLVCDLDHFKRINDARGHEAGDDVLRRFARVLRETVRGPDLPTRLGGEEFAAVLTGADDATAAGVGERLRRAVHAEFADDPVPVTVSVGVASTGAGTGGCRELVRAAHRALYAAKGLGRDRVVVYEPATVDVLEALGRDDAAEREQLAAAILLAETLDLRDVGTARHSRTVGRYAELVARELGWPAREIERVRTAGLLHDIGKLGVPDGVLHKAGPLDDAEREEVERHPELGARILEHANLRDLAAWVLDHHERMDGRGYPRGLAGGAIPLEARVLAVADAYEAMTADRPYRRPLDEDAARRELVRAAGSQFDADVVHAFLRALDRDPAGAAAPA